MFWITAWAVIGFVAPLMLGSFDLFGSWVCGLSAAVIAYSWQYNPS